MTDQLMATRPAAMSTPATETKQKVFLNQEQSTEIMKIMLSGTISAAMYLRGIFVEGVYQHRSFNLEDPNSTYTDFKNMITDVGNSARSREMNELKWPMLVRGRNVNADRFLDWLENGIFDAMEKQYLASAQLGLFKGEVHPEKLIESFIVSFSYKGGAPSMNLQHSSEPKGVPFTIARDNLNEILGKLNTELARPLNLHDQKTVSIQLRYNDSCPIGYTAPGFKVCTDPKLVLDEEVGDSVGNTIDTVHHRAGVRYFSQNHVADVPADEDASEGQNEDGSQEDGFELDPHRLYEVHLPDSNMRIPEEVSNDYNLRSQWKHYGNIPKDYAWDSLQEYLKACHNAHSHVYRGGHASEANLMRAQGKIPALAWKRKANPGFQYSHRTPGIKKGNTNKKRKSNKKGKSDAGNRRVSSLRATPNRASLNTTSSSYSSPINTSPYTSSNETAASAPAPSNSSFSGPLIFSGQNQRSKEQEIVSQSTSMLSDLTNARQPKDKGTAGRSTSMASDVTGAQQSQGNTQVQDVREMVISRSEDNMDTQKVDIPDLTGLIDLHRSTPLPKIKVARTWWCQTMRECKALPRPNPKRGCLCECKENLHEMVKCDACDSMHHIHCYGYLDGSEVPENFICYECLLFHDQKLLSDMKGVCLHRNFLYNIYREDYPDLASEDKFRNRMNLLKINFERIIGYLVPQGFLKPIDLHHRNLPGLNRNYEVVRTPEQLEKLFECWFSPRYLLKQYFWLPDEKFVWRDLPSSPSSTESESMEDSSGHGLGMMSAPSGTQSTSGVKIVVGQNAGDGSGTQGNSQGPAGSQGYGGQSSGDGVTQPKAPEIPHSAPHTAPRVAPPVRCELSVRYGRVCFCPGPCPPPRRQMNYNEEFGGEPRFPKISSQKPVPTHEGRYETFDNGLAFPDRPLDEVKKRWVRGDPLSQVEFHTMKIWSKKFWHNNRALSTSNWELLRQGVADGLSEVDLGELMLRHQTGSFGGPRSNNPDRPPQNPDVNRMSAVSSTQGTPSPQVSSGTSRDPPKVRSYSGPGTIVETSGGFYWEPIRYDPDEKPAPFISEKERKEREEKERKEREEKELADLHQHHKSWKEKNLGVQSRRRSRLRDELDSFADRADRPGPGLMADGPLADLADFSPPSGYLPYYPPGEGGVEVPETPYSFRAASDNRPVSSKDAPIPLNLSLEDRERRINSKKRTRSYLERHLDQGSTSEANSTPKGKEVWDPYGPDRMD